MVVNMKKALVAMSGGVDSSVSAALMCEKGYDCIGVTMKLYERDETCESSDKACCTLSDVEDARSICHKLGMRYYVSNFKEDFSEQVIARFIKAYETGATPNPCIDCNRYMKFEKLYHRAKEQDCDLIVTGHYARIEKDPKTGRFLLKKSKNIAKDQSYVLYFMSQEQLAHTYFPLGEFSDKEEVRKIAEKYGFVNARKHDSQDICFVPDGNYGNFIEEYAGKSYPPGDFVDLDGNVLGRHKGLIRYTIGQRKGLGLSLKAPMYVYAKDLENNTVILSSEKELFKNKLVAADFNWIAFEAPGGPIRVTAKTRYHAREAAATATVLSDGKVEVEFDEPQRAITSGQAVVLYNNDIVAGGGTIV